MPLTPASSASAGCAAGGLSLGEQAATESQGRAGQGWAGVAAVQVWGLDQGSFRVRSQGQAQG